MGLLKRPRHDADGRTVTGHYIEGRIKTRAYRDAWLERLEEVVAKLNEEWQARFLAYRVSVEYRTVWGRSGKTGPRYVAGDIYEASIFADSVGKVGRGRYFGPTRVVAGLGRTIDESLRNLEVDIRTSTRLDRYCSFKHDS